MENDLTYIGTGRGIDLLRCREMRKETETCTEIRKDRVGVELRVWEVESEGLGESRGIMVIDSDH